MCLSQRNWQEWSQFHKEGASIGTVCSGIAHRVARSGQFRLHWVDSLAEYDRQDAAARFYRALSV